MEQPCPVCNAPASERVSWSYCCAEKRDAGVASKPWHTLHVDKIDSLKRQWAQRRRDPTKLGSLAEWAIEYSYIGLLKQCLVAKGAAVTTWAYHAAALNCVPALEAIHDHDPAMVHVAVRGGGIFGEVVNTVRVSIERWDVAALPALRLLLRWGVALDAPSMGVIMERKGVELMEEVCNPQNRVDLEGLYMKGGVGLLAFAMAKCDWCVGILVDAGIDISPDEAAIADAAGFPAVVAAFKSWSGNALRRLWIGLAVRAGRRGEDHEVPRVAKAPRM